MKKIVNLLGHGLFYTIAISIESLAPFILAPFLTHHFSVYDYGVWAIFQASYSFLRPLLGMSLDDFVRIRHSDHARDRIIGYLLAIIALSGVISLLFCAIAMLLGNPLSRILHFPAGWLWSIFMCAWMQAMFYMLLAYYQFELQRRRYAIIHLTQALATLAFSMSLVWAGWSWHGAVIGKICGLACGTLLAWFWIARHFPQSALSYFRMPDLREVLSFGLRYMGNGIAFAVIVLTNRLMLANMVSVETSSLFAIASMFPMALLIVIHGYVYGWQPWCFKRLARREASDRLELVAGAGLFFVGLPIGGLILSWGSCWLGPYVINQEYHGAFDYIPLLSLAMVMQGCYYFSQTILQYYKRLETLSLIAYATMVINIGLNFILIKDMGAVGCCWANIIAYLAGFVLTSAFASRHLMHYFSSLRTEHARV